MKTRLNLICTLVFVSLICSFFVNSYLGADDFIQGFNEGRNSAIENSLLISLRTAPTEMVSDSVFDTKAEIWLPVVYKSMLVRVPEVEQPWYISDPILILCLLGCFISFIWMLISAYKFIRNINRSIIFEWINVRYLRSIGTAFIIYFLTHTLWIYLDYIQSADVIEMEGYRFIPKEMVDMKFLIAGLVTFLIAEVFAIGLRIKTENELTI